jgi:hypothetical protein
MDREKLVFKLAGALKRGLQDTDYYMDAEIAEECARIAVEAIEEAGYEIRERPSND